jgi:A/G-specific adenine glycosylase
MELGAQVCLPRAPRCGGCPLMAHCRALAAGRVGEFPPVARRRPVERVRRAVAVIERDGRRLLARRSGRLLDGLWEPPGLDLADGVAAGAALRGLLRGLGVRARLRDTGRRVRHGITHRDIEVEVWGGELLGAPPRRPDLRWERPHGGRLALTALARKLARG